MFSTFGCIRICRLPARARRRAGPRVGVLADDANRPVGNKHRRERRERPIGLIDSIDDAKIGTDLLTGELHERISTITIVEELDAGILFQAVLHVAEPGVITAVRGN